jgi:xanthine phosphoribosyltransferase
VVFAKKEEPNTMNEDSYSAEIMSFTKMKMTKIRIAKKFLNRGERILVIDDFLAHGLAALGLINLIEQSGAKIQGVGIVIEKSFQGGGQKLRDRGVRVESLAVVSKIQNGKIYF